MIDLALKLIPRPDPSAPGGDEEDDPCWKYIGSDMAHSRLPAKLRFVIRNASDEIRKLSDDIMREYFG